MSDQIEQRIVTTFTAEKLFRDRMTIAMFFGKPRVRFTLDKITWNLPGTGQWAELARYDDDFYANRHTDLMWQFGLERPGYDPLSFVFNQDWRMLTLVTWIFGVQGELPVEGSPARLTSSPGYHMVAELGRIQGGNSADRQFRMIREHPEDKESPHTIGKDILLAAINQRLAILHDEGILVNELPIVRSTSRTESYARLSGYQGFMLEQSNPGRYFGRTLPALVIRWIEENHSRPQLMRFLANTEIGPGAIFVSQLTRFENSVQQILDKIYSSVI